MTTPLPQLPPLPKPPLLVYLRDPTQESLQRLQAASHLDAAYMEIWEELRAARGFGPLEVPPEGDRRFLEPPVLPDPDFPTVGLPPREQEETHFPGGEVSYFPIGTTPQEPEGPPLGRRMWYETGRLTGPELTDLKKVGPLITYSLFLQNTLLHVLPVIMRHVPSVDADLQRWDSMLHILRYNEAAILLCHDSLSLPEVAGWSEGHQGGQLVRYDTYRLHRRFPAAYTSVLRPMNARGLLAVWSYLIRLFGTAPTGGALLAITELLTVTELCVRGGRYSSMYPEERFRQAYPQHLRETTLSWGEWYYVYQVRKMIQAAYDRRA